jgi:hypothetical protein
MAGKSYYAADSTGTVCGEREVTTMDRIYTEVCDVVVQPCLE